MLSLLNFIFWSYHWTFLQRFHDWRLDANQIVFLHRFIDIQEWNLSSVEEAQHFKEKLLFLSKLLSWINWHSYPWYSKGFFQRAFHILWLPKTICHTWRYTFVCSKPEVPCKQEFQLLSSKNYCFMNVLRIRSQLSWEFIPWIGYFTVSNLDG